MEERSAALNFPGNSADEAKVVAATGTQPSRPERFGRYLLLERCVMSDTLLDFGQTRRTFFADSSARHIEGAPLGLIFHSFTGDDNAPVAHASLPG